MRTFSKPLFLLSLLGLLLGLGGCESGGTMTVVFPDFGSADCGVIFTENATVVIDTGETSDGDALLQLLADYGRTEVDLLIISHYDKDHVGGAAQLISALPVKRVIGSTSPKDSDAYAAYLDALQAAGLSEEIPQEISTISLDGLQITLLPPEQERYSQGQSNNSSLMVSLLYGDTSFLFTGDALEERMAEALSDLQGRTYDLIKVPHHGRDESVCQSLFSALGDADTIAIVTSSKKEPESDAVMALLPQSTYRTRKGTVTVVSNGKNLTVTQS